MKKSSDKRRIARPGKHSRQGAVLSLELLLTLPVVLGLFLAMVEFGILLASHQQLENGCRVACRMATLPGFQEEQIETALQKTLQWENLATHCEIQSFEPGEFTGDRVELSVRVPMKAAAPDMLGLVGLALDGKMLHARAVMRRE